MDLQDKSATIKKVMSVYEQIMKATNDEQLEEEKTNRYLGLAYTWRGKIL